MIHENEPTNIHKMLSKNKKNIYLNRKYGEIYSREPYVGIDSIKDFRKLNE
jgi:hypothetical protein